MAKNFLVSLNLNKNELQNAAVQSLSTNPAAPVTGQIYYNTSDKVIKLYNGSNWLDLATSTGSSTITGVTGTNGVSASTSGGVVTVSHADTSSVADSTNTGSTVLQSITFDGFGHVQTVSTKALTLSDLGYTGANDADKYIGFTIDANSGVTSNIGPEGVITLSGDGINTIASGTSVEFVNTDKGSGQNIFKNIVADTGANSVADNNNDTLTLAGGDGMNTISTPDSDTITFSVDSTVVRTSGSQTIGGDKTFSNDVVVNGNLTVSGSVVTTISEIVNVEDNIMYLNSNVTGTPTEDSGFIVNRGTSDNAGVVWDESADEFAFFTTSDNASVSTVTIGAYADIKGANLRGEKLFLSNIVPVSFDVDKFVVVDGQELKTRTGAQVRSDIGAGTVSSVGLSGSGAINVSGSTITGTGSFTVSVDSANTTQLGVVELATGAETIGMTDTERVVTPASLDATRVRANVGDGVATSFAVQHDFGTKDIIVQVFDNSSGDTVITDVTRTNTNVATIAFNSPPSTDAYRVLIIRA